MSQHCHTGQQSYGLYWLFIEITKLVTDMSEVLAASRGPSHQETGTSAAATASHSLATHTVSLCSIIIARHESILASFLPKMQLYGKLNLHTERFLSGNFIRNKMD